MGHLECPILNPRRSKVRLSLLYRVDLELRKTLHHKQMCVQGKYYTFERDSMALNGIMSAKLGPRNVQPAIRNRHATLQSVKSTEATVFNSLCANNVKPLCCANGSLPLAMCKNRWKHAYL